MIWLASIGAAMLFPAPAASGWAWIPGDQLAAKEDLHVYFRREFEVTGPISGAEIKVSADSRYVLYLNGRKLGRGPLKGDLRHYSYEQYDLKPYLRSGRNVIAAHVHHGTGLMSEMHCGRGAFWCSGSIRIGQRAVDVSTPGEWKCTAHTGWQTSSGKRTGYLAHLVNFDAGPDPQGWMQPGFEDSGWQTPEALDSEMWSLVPRDLPQMSEEPVRPVRVTEASSVAGAEALCKGQPLVLRPGVDSEASFVLDFGRELTGTVRFEVEGPAGAVLELMYAEHPGSYIGGADRYTLRAGRQLFETYHYQGFRYLRVTASQLKAPVRIRSLVTVFTSYPLQPHGSFACSDPLLNQIWQVGCHSLRCCLHETYEDCPGYEQLQYWGDARVETMVQMAAFGDSRPFARGLRALSWSRQPDGITFSRYPCTEKQIIPTFSLIWILSLEDYQLWTGDRRLVNELWPTAEGILSWFDSHVGDSGVLEDVPHWIFIDWSGGLGRPAAGGASSALNAFYYGALRAAARLCDSGGQVQKAAEYRERARQLLRSFEAAFWSGERRAYVDELRDGKQGEGVSQHSQALALLFEMAPRERRQALVQQMMRQDITQATPYFMFYVLRALDQSGRYDLALEQMKRWKVMLDAGATTWLETWGNKRSWCHAWSSAPTYELSTRVLGIRPAGAGFSKAIIEPQTSGLQWAKGAVPTPHGPISVEWRIKSGRMHLEYSAPAEIGVTLRTPAGAVVRRKAYKRL